MTGYPWGLYIDDAAPGSGQAALDDELQIRNVILAGVEHWGGNSYGSAGTIFSGAPANGVQHPKNSRGVVLRSHANFPGGQEIYENWFHNETFNNQLVDHWGLLGIDGSIFDLGIPKVKPNAGSMLLTATLRRLTTSLIRCHLSELLEPKTGPKAGLNGMLTL
ncbi:MAG TPA: hypothetical protein ENN08_02060 [Bacteroidales bacterium]|nr:hypothetical protein [Bacteroidales bacterium]